MVPKQKHKKGLWSPDEDQKLKNYIMKHGHGCWSSVPINAGLQRNGKSCRLRWINYLRPGLKRGAFNAEEEEAIMTLHHILGNKWSQIAQHLPGRTDNEVKNNWHSYLKKRVSKQQMAETTANNDSDEGKSKTNRSFESFENNVIIMDTTDDQSLQIHNDKRPCIEEGIHNKSNLPKVLFAEWLSLDNFQGQIISSSSGFSTSSNSVLDFKSTIENDTNNNNIVMSEDSLVHNVLLNEGALNPHQENSITVEDMLHHSTFEEEQLSAGYFPGEFAMNYDDMYI